MMITRLKTQLKYLVLVSATLIPFQNCGKLGDAARNSYTSAPLDSQGSTRDSVLLVAPSQLSAQPVSSSQINLSWTDNSTNESGYAVERAVAASGPFVKIQSLVANSGSYSDNGLSPTTAYYYRVSATDAVGNSGPTAVTTATTTAVPVSPPSPPSNLMANAVSSTSIVLSWNDNSNNESNFNIERSLATPALSFTQIATVSANVNTYSDINLTPQTPYTYRVRATNSAGSSAYTANANATTMTAVVNTNTFSSISSSILQVRCTGCHIFDYNGVLRYVVKGNSAQSQLYTAVANGSMPPSGSDLTAAQVASIKAWIDSGALNN